MESWPLSLPQYPERQFTSSIISGASDQSDTNNEKRLDTYPKYSVVFVFKARKLSDVLGIRNFYCITLNEVEDFTAPWLDMSGFPSSFCNFSSPPTFTERGGVWEISLPLTITKHVPMVNGEIVYGDM